MHQRPFLAFTRKPHVCTQNTREGQTLGMCRQVSPAGAALPDPGAVARGPWPWAWRPWPGRDGRPGEDKVPGGRGVGLGKGPPCRPFLPEPRETQFTASARASFPGRTGVTLPQTETPFTGRCPPAVNDRKHLHVHVYIDLRLTCLRGWRGPST